MIQWDGGCPDFLSRTKLSQHHHHHPLRHLPGSDSKVRKQKTVTFFGSEKQPEIWEISLTGITWVAKIFFCPSCILFDLILALDKCSCVERKLLKTTSEAYIYLSMCQKEAEHRPLLIFFTLFESSFIEDRSRVSRTSGSPGANCPRGICLETFLAATPGVGAAPDIKKMGTLPSPCKAQGSSALGVTPPKYHEHQGGGSSVRLTEFHHPGACLEPSGPRRKPPSL
nr:uncharacterized protein LOC105464793 [Macaca nemestrina]